MRAHEAGALHAEAGARDPSWLSPPDDPNALVPHLWPRNVTKSQAGMLVVAGVSVGELAAEFGTPAYIVDEHDFRQRAREFKQAFAGYDVYYAGKAFLSLATVRWIAEEGLNLDVCTGGELAVALRAGLDPAASASTATTRAGRSWCGRSRSASGASWSTQSSRSSGSLRSPPTMGFASRCSSV